MPDSLDPRLRQVVDLLESMPRDDAPEPSPDLEARVAAAVAAVAAEPADELTRRRARRGLARAPRRLLTAVACVALLAIGVGAGIALTSDGGPAGVREIAGELRGDGAVATVTVRRLGYGRSVQLRSDTLPELPPDEFYELWFVGPGDRPGSPNRISGGTFHPDAEGRSRVTLKAAVDPAQYPRIVLSREPGDGDPAPSGDDILRLDG